MSFTVDNIRRLCALHGTTLAKLEEGSNPSPAANKEEAARPHGWAVFCMVEPFALLFARRFSFTIVRKFTIEKATFLPKRQ